MRFNEIVPHLAQRGFVSRVIWQRMMVLAYDNTELPFIHKIDKTTEPWSPTLDCLNSTDWYILPFIWESSEDDFIPFEHLNQWNDIGGNLKKLNKISSRKLKKSYPSVKYLEI